MSDETVERLRQFLDQVEYPPEQPLVLDPYKGIHPFVTISRQTGAGGHTLANALVLAMQEDPDSLLRGWRVFDQELCRRLLDDPALRVSTQSLFTEEYRTVIADLIHELIGGGSPQATVIRKTFELIRTLVTFGKVVIVGRGAACLTKDLPYGVHVRLVASEPVRIRRMMTLLACSEEAARRTIHEQDVARARLVADYFHRDINDPLLYDVVWNTDTVPLESMTASLITLIRHRAAPAAHREAARA